MKTAIKKSKNYLWRIKRVNWTKSNGEKGECFALQSITRPSFFRIGWDDDFWGSLEDCIRKMDVRINYDNRPTVKIKYS
jgi:hypothetical protein